MKLVKNAQGQILVTCKFIYLLRYEILPWLMLYCIGCSVKLKKTSGNCFYTKAALISHR